MSDDGDGGTLQVLADSLRSRAGLLRLGVEDLARALCWTPDEVVSRLVGDGAGPLYLDELHELATVLHTRWGLLINTGRQDGGAVEQLRQLPMHWWISPEFASALQTLGSWYQSDYALNMCAEMFPGAREGSLVAHGIPGALEETVPRVCMPVLDIDSTVAEADAETAAFDLARQLREQVGGPANTTIGPIELATAFELPYGWAPLGTRVLAAAGNADRRPALVLNSAVLADEVAAAGVHLSVHLLCGDVTVVGMRAFEADGAESESCLGTSEKACARARLVTRLLRTGRPSTASPLVSMVADSTVMPAGLAWRFLRVMAAGFGVRVPVEQLGLDLPHYPTTEDYQQAESAYAIESSRRTNEASTRTD